MVYSSASQALLLRKPWQIVRVEAVVSFSFIYSMDIQGAFSANHEVRGPQVWDGKSLWESVLIKK